jgi:uncharacterized protein (DUF952 family)
MAIIYHVTTAKAWEAAKKHGAYEADSLATEGFMHCSEGHQVAGVLQRYFKGKENLVQLTIDTDVVQHRLQYDVAPSLNEAFPHIYGPLNIEAVLEVVPIDAGSY